MRTMSGTAMTAPTEAIRIFQTKLLVYQEVRESASLAPDEYFDIIARRRRLPLARRLLRVERKGVEESLMIRMCVEELRRPRQPCPREAGAAMSMCSMNDCSRKLFWPLCRRTRSASSVAAPRVIGIQQIAVAGLLEEGKVKTAVGLAIVIPILRSSRVSCARSLCPASTATGPVSHGLANRFILDQRTKVTERADVFGRRWENVGARLRYDGHQTLVPELHEGGAHRRLAHAERIGDEGLGKLFAEFEAAGNDGIRIRSNASRVNDMSASFPDRGRAACDLSSSAAIIAMPSCLTMKWNSRILM